MTHFSRTSVLACLSAILGTVWLLDPSTAAAQSFVANPPDLFFAVQVGSTTNPQTISLTSTGAQMTFTATPSVSTPAGGSWLLVSSSSNVTPSTLTVSIFAFGLAPNNTDYTGAITVRATNGSATLVIPIALNVFGDRQLALDSNSLNIVATAGVNPDPEQLQVIAVGSHPGQLTFTATVTTNRGGNWLSVSPNPSTTPRTLTIAVNVQGLSLGDYSGTIAISDTANRTELVQVFLRVGLSPNISRVINSASTSPDAPVSSSSIASLFGSDLATTTAFASVLPLPNILGGTQVRVNGVVAPLYLVSPTEIVFQIPAGLTGSTVQLAVTVSGSQGPAFTANLAPESPGIFTTSQDGTGQGAILNQDLSANSARNPAARGSTIHIYATGLGATNPALAAGQPGRTVAPFNVTTTTPVVLIGSISATVTFSAMAPNFVGVYVVDAVIPNSVTPESAVVVQIQMGSRSSNIATVAIQ